VEYSELLPCFDSSDYIHENRSRSEYYFVDSYDSAKLLYKDFEKGTSTINTYEIEKLSFVINDPEDKTFITVTK